MIKIDDSTIFATVNGKSLADRHIEWFLGKIKSKCKWNRKETYQQFLTRELKLNKNNNFKDEITPYILGNKQKIDDLINSHTYINNLKNSRLKNHILEAFQYASFDNKNESKDSWGAYKFCKGLNIDVCPYCNRQYIFTVTKKKIKGSKGGKAREGSEENFIRPEMDHFYPKDIYPYLSCNLYNLIPSCHSCNNSKSDKDTGTQKFTIIYPYTEQFGNSGVFKVKINNIDLSSDTLFENNFNSNELRLKIESTGVLKKKIEHAKEIFHLEEVYNMHELEINDFLKRYRLYRDPKRKEILQLFHDADSNNQIDEKQLNLFLNIMSSKMEKEILGMFEVSESKQYPLKKMKTDLKKQFDDSSVK